MNINHWKRILSCLLSVCLFFGILQNGSFAAETKEFILVVEAEGRLVVLPEYISYTEGQTIKAALAESNHTFEGMDTGLITAIDGITGNFRISDENGNYDLSRPASSIGYLRFSEEENSKQNAGLFKLMKAMADYSLEESDVKTAAKAAYEQAKDQFVGLDSDSAETLAKNLTDAVAAYKNQLAGTKYTVTFMNGSVKHSGAEISVKNAYGKAWTDENRDGEILLPAGNYEFSVSQDGYSVKGKFQVTKNLSVNAEFATELWLNQETFRLSGSYGEEDNEEHKFSTDEFSLESWDNRTITVPVPDTFHGTIYSYAEYQNLEKLPTLTAISCDAVTGEAKETTISFESLRSGVENVLTLGAKGAEVIYRVSSSGANGNIYTQDYTINFERIPTLKGIVVEDKEGTDQAATDAFDAAIQDYTYKVLNNVEVVTVKPIPFLKDYDVTVNGQKMGTEKISVTLNKENGKPSETKIPIRVSYGNYSSTYTITVLPGEGQQITFETKGKDVTVQVVNRNGQVMPCKRVQNGADSNRYLYVLNAEDDYKYVATKDVYFHTTDDFTLETLANSTVTVDVPTEHWLTGFSVGSTKTESDKGNLPLDTAFEPSKHAYEIVYADNEHNVYVWAESEKADSIQAIYTQNHLNSRYHGKEHTVKLISGLSEGTQLSRLLMDENPIENTVTIRLKKVLDGITCYQDYQIDCKRSLTLKNITADCDDSTMSLLQQDTEKKGFLPNIKEYSVTVPMVAQSLNLKVELYKTNKCYGETAVGYQLFFKDEEVTDLDTLEIPLDGTIDTQNVVLTVKNDKAPEGSAEYVIHILKSPPVEAKFLLEPTDAQLTIYENLSEERVWPTADGCYQLCEGFSYDYTLTKYGYVAKAGTLQVTRNEEKALVVLDGDAVHAVSGNESQGGSVGFEWKIDAAKKNVAIKENLSSKWPDFRGNPENNGISDAKMPIEAEEGTLYWANKIGDGFDSGAVGSPIIVNDELITYAGNKIFRVDRVTGEIVKEGFMNHRSSFGITPPGYAEGMVFVALSDGTVQAFNAKTLESLWIYRDPLGGQPNSPLTIKDGYLYTGFWNSETGRANFVCLSITDEDPTQEKETKYASWSYTRKGGFYWAGAYVNEDYVLVGTDDGTNACDGKSASVLMFDSKTGELLNHLDKLNGDIRCGIVYDQETDAYYFTSKGGSFYSFRTLKTQEGFQLTEFWEVKLQNGTESTPMSTSSPVVYGGRAYVGVSGSNQFGDYSGHNITVIDLKTKKIAYQVMTQGYPQTSGLLTNAYGEYVYVYFFENTTPGKLRVLRDKAGQTHADYITKEEEFDTAYVLFTPTGDQAQYAICSPIVDEYGTIYFKNDSAHLMAFGNRIQKIEITKLPNQTSYVEGAVFDPEGMVVTATYANGMTRDVTRYVTVPKEPLSLQDREITISFEHVLYHNTEGGSSTESVIASVPPTTTLKLTFKEATLGDVNQDGAVTEADAKRILECTAQNKSATYDVETADVNGDDVVNTDDAVLILQYLAGKITLEEIKENR